MLNWIIYCIGLFTVFTFLLFPMFPQFLELDFMPNPPGPEVAPTSTATEQWSRSSEPTSWWA